MKVFLIFCLFIFSPLSLSAERQNEERNKAATIRFYEEVCNKGNVDAIDEVFAPDYIAHDTSAGAPRTSESADTQKRMAQGIRSFFSDYSFQPEFLIAEGDKVVARWTIRGKPTALLSIIAASEVKISGASIFRFENGKIVEIWNHRDDLGAQKQLGISKVPYAIGFVAGLGVYFVAWLGLRLKRNYSSRRLVANAVKKSGALISHRQDTA